ncbi:MAG: hypothetical protein HXY30_14925 [Pseudorhodoplanes sp.]|nr:hypothetical protein [Pseudorhodoplanes sp.]
MTKLLAFLPLPWRLGLMAAIAAALGGIYLHWRNDIYDKGRDDAKAAIEQQDRDAAQRAREVLSQTRACRDAGGTWDQSRWVCARPLRDGD